MAARRKSTVRVLLLAANPSNSGNLRLDQEARDIQEVLDRAEVVAEVRYVTAVRPRDLPKKLRAFRPNFVHFSGHGEKSEGIILENASGRATIVPEDALASLFQLFRGVKCVFLNSCYSNTQAAIIAKYVPYVIGMREAISDSAAMEFSFGFYQAISDGETIPYAFRYGVTAIRLANISTEWHIPELFRTPSRSKQRGPLDQRPTAR
jgi:CHAT domain